MINCPVPRAHRKLVFDFFWKFSAFECALKRGDYLRENREYADADWAKFGSDIDSRFSMVPSPGFQEAVAKIKRLSPQRQVNRGVRLAWEPVQKRDKDSEAAYILTLLKTVRNNLFHGGKYRDGSVISEVARDRELLQAALTVLDGCFDLHPDINP